MKFSLYRLVLYFFQNTLVFSISHDSNIGNEAVVESRVGWAKGLLSGLGSKWYLSPLRMGRGPGWARVGWARGLGGLRYPYPKLC